MNFTKSKTAKFAAGVVGFAIALAFVVTPVTSSAQSTADLQAQIAGLLAQIAQLQAAMGGGSMTGGSAPVAPLTLGSSGSEVTKLQSWLMSKGFSIPAGATGYFGAQTQAALAAFQAANGISPAAGYYGPITAAKVASMSGSMTPGTPGTPGSDLQGGAGSVDSYDLKSKFNNEDVGEGEEEVSVMSFEVDVDDGSDLEFTSMKVWFENQDTGSSEDFDDFAESVQIWLDGELVGEADVEDFSSDDTSGTETDNSTSDSIDEWEKNIALEDAVIEAGETGEFTISVTAVNSIDSADHDSDDWDVAVHTIRFEDADGAVISETPSISTSETAFNFGTFASASGLEMKVELSDDNLDSHVVNVDATDETEDVELLRFSIEADGSDLTINDIPFLLTVSQPTVTDDVDFIVNNLTLTADGTDYSEAVSTSAGSTATITFDDLGIEIEDGDTLEFVLAADINDTQASEFVDGDTLSAQVTVDDIDADDAEGDSVSDADATGTATGESLAFYDVGIMVTLVSATEEMVPGADGTADDDTVNLTLKFNVEAFDGTVYVSNQATPTTAADGAVTAIDVDDGGILYRYEIDNSATVSLISDTVSKTDTSGTVDDDGVDEYTFTDGESADITLLVTRANATTEALSDGYHDMIAVAFGWSATQDDDTMEVYEFNLDDFKTDPIFAN